MFTMYANSYIKKTGQAFLYSVAVHLYPSMITRKLPFALSIIAPFIYSCF